MAIPFKRYVDITSGIGAGGQVARRELMARLFTSSPELPTNTVMEFNSANDVGDFFGTDSEEHKRSVFYFSFISKSVSQPNKISFYRWTIEDASSTIYSSEPKPLAEIKKIAEGLLTLNIEDKDHTVKNINFNEAKTYSDIASILQKSIRSTRVKALNKAEVIYQPTKKRFSITSGIEHDLTINNTIPVTMSDRENVSAAMGFNIVSDEILFSEASPRTSITDTLEASAEKSNNFGSYAFIPTLTLAQVTESAAWNTTQNLLYQYHIPVTASDAESYSDALADYEGTGLTLDPEQDGEWPELLPMAILAATDYSRPAATQNYMYQTANLTPSVTSNTDANKYDSLRINYYGETQTAGQERKFYQRGVLCGNSDRYPVDINTYANEQWLKDDAGAAIMTLLLSQPRVPANEAGRGSLLATLQATIEQAVTNGTIQTGSALETHQIIYITDQSQDPDAWRQVQSIGYWTDATIQPVSTSDNRTEYKAVYILIYAIDNAIRSVSGTHQLI